MKKFIIFLLIVALAIGIFIFYKDGSDTNTTENIEDSTENVSTASPKKYSDDNYGFSFSYPADYTIEKKSSEEIWVGKGEGGTFRTIFTVRLIKNSSDFELQSYEEFALDQARLVCVEKSPSGAANCTQIKDLTEFKTTAGVDGEAFYIWGGGSVTHGPFYAFNTSENTEGVVSLALFGASFSSFLTADEAKILRDSAASFKLD